MRFLLPELNRIVHQYHRSVSFLFVYILEAHAADEWPIKELEQEIPQHRSVQDRIKCANDFVNGTTAPIESASPRCTSCGDVDTQCVDDSALEAYFHPAIRVVCDNEDDAFVNVYTSWPFRYWVLHQGKLALKLMPHGDKVSLDSLRDLLANFHEQAERKSELTIA